MIARPHHLVIDCPDPGALAGFYAELFGLPVTYRSEDFVVVARDDTTSGFGFQLAPDHRAPQWPDPEHPQQMHLDVMVDDLDLAEPRVLALGARRLAGGDHVYADPAGHPFCLIPRPGWAPPVLLAASDVRLERVTDSTWRACAGLTVRPDQSAHVAAVTHYLCLCAYGSTWQPLAILRDEAVVGFCMWGVDEDGSRWIGGLVVDAPAQRTGVARSALTALIRWFEAQPGCTGVALSYSPDNAAARSLYSSLDFRETGETEDDGAEVVARRSMRAPRRGQPA